MYELRVVRACRSNSTLGEESVLSISYAHIVWIVKDISSNKFFR